MADSRKAIHAFLSPDSHEAWHEFAAEHGVSVSGLIEAIALDWADRSQRGNGGSVDYDLDEVDALSRQARRIDASRRRRSRR
jgi:hypothetical protein